MKIENRDDDNDALEPRAEGVVACLAMFLLDTIGKIGRIHCHIVKRDYYLQH